MRKAVLMLLLVIVSNSAMAEWTLVGPSTNGKFIIYADLSTIRKKALL